MAFEARPGGGNVVQHDGRKQRFLVGEPRVDGRLAGAGDAGNLVDASAGKAALEKHAAGGAEDALIDLACGFPRRTADAPRPPLRCPPFRPLTSGHSAPSHFCDHAAASLAKAKKAAAFLGV